MFGLASACHDVADVRRCDLPPHIGRSGFPQAEMPPLHGDVAGEQQPFPVPEHRGRVVSDPHHIGRFALAYARGQAADQLEFPVGAAH